MEKAKELVRTFKMGDSGARDEIFISFVKIMQKTISEDNIARNFYEKTKKQDIANDFACSAIELLEAKNLEKPFGYLKEMSKTVLADKLRKDIKEKRREIKSVVTEDKKLYLSDQIEDPRATRPGSKEYHGGISKEESTRALYVRRIPEEIREGINRCLDYLEDLYRFKEIIKSDPTPKILDILLDTRKKLINKLGRKIEKQAARFNELYSKAEAKEKRHKELFPSDRILSKEEFEKIQRKYPDFSLLSSSELKEYDDLKEKRRWWDALDKIDKQIYIHQNLLFEGFHPITWIMPSLKPKKWYFETQDYLILNLRDFRITPPRLLFEILIKLNGLKKGKYLDRGKIRRIFYHLKNSTADTKKEFLFKSINESDFNDKRLALKLFENIRKSTDRGPKNSKFYERLINTIYEVSFIEKIDIEDAYGLSLYFLKKTKPKSYAAMYGNMTIKKAILFEEQIKKKFKGDVLKPKDSTELL